jgi:hypothetical protein
MQIYFIKKQSRMEEQDRRYGWSPSTYHDKLHETFKRVFKGGKSSHIATPNE